MMLPDSYHPQSRGTKTMVYSNRLANEIKDVMCKPQGVTLFPKKIPKISRRSWQQLTNSTPLFPGLSPYKNLHEKHESSPSRHSHRGRRPRPNRWMRSDPRSGLRNRHLTFPSTVQRSRCTGLEGSIFKTPHFLRWKNLLETGENLWWNAWAPHCSTHLLRWDFGLWLKVAKSWKVPTKIFVGGFSTKHTCSFVAI